MADAKISSFASHGTPVGEDYVASVLASGPTSKRLLLSDIRDYTNMLYSASSADANIALAINTLHVVDISGYTADRTATLPAVAAVGDRVGLALSVGDTAFELLITATAGDTLNGIAGGTEWSRVFITGEVVIMRCTVANTTWIVEYDGRIPCRVYFQNSGISLTQNTVMYPDWTATIDTGAQYFNTTKDCASIRRAGLYHCISEGVSQVMSASGKALYARVVTDPNGTPVVARELRVHSSFAERLGSIAAVKLSLAVDATVTAAFFCTDTAGTSSVLSLEMSEELAP